MTSNTFAIPFTEKQLSSDPYGLKDFVKMKLDRKYFLVDSRKTAILAGMDTFGNLCIFAGPECFKAMVQFNMYMVMQATRSLAHQ